jgi:hypothetical protein
MEGVFGTRRWMAQPLGKAGGRSTFTAKKKATRATADLAAAPRGNAYQGIAPGTFITSLRRI